LHNLKLALDLWIVKYYIGYTKINLNFIGFNLFILLGQLLVVLHVTPVGFTRLRAVKQPELIPGHCEKGVDQPMKA